MNENQGEKVQDGPALQFDDGEHVETDASCVNEEDEGPEMPLGVSVPNNVGDMEDYINLEKESAEDLKNDDTTDSVATTESDNRNYALQDSDDEYITVPNGLPIISITFSNGDPVDNYKPKFLRFISRFTELRALDLSNAIHLYSEDTNAIADIQTKECKQMSNDLFTLDLNPSPTELDDRMVKFSSKYRVLEEEEKEQEQKIGSKVKCFNCGRSHTIKNCPEPKDSVKIRLARQKFNSYATKCVRYHKEEDQKFAHLVPGRISDKLRVALGLGICEVPKHVYKMRINGYPPGWLEEAKVVQSNISLFDIEGKNVTAKGGIKGTHLDPAKIVDYPGFNTMFELGSRDEFHKHGVPPFTPSHSKDAMVQFANNIYDEMADDLETCDMDIDISSDDGTSEETEEEEVQNKRVLAELVMNDNSNTESNGDKDNGTPNGCCIRNRGPARAGTPILKSASPYSHLPNADNFSKDVSTFIHFENLPNSTGKYEQMTNVLQKVRKIQKNIQELSLS